MTPFVLALIVAALAMVLLRQAYRGVWGEDDDD